MIKSAARLVSVLCLFFSSFLMMPSDAFVANKPGLPLTATTATSRALPQKSLLLPSEEWLARSPTTATAMTQRRRFDSALSLSVSDLIYLSDGTLTSVFRSVITTIVIVFGIAVAAPSLFVILFALYVTGKIWLSPPMEIILNEKHPEIVNKYVFNDDFEKAFEDYDLIGDVSYAIAKKEGISIPTMVEAAFLGANEDDIVDDDDYTVFRVVMAQLFLTMVIHFPFVLEALSKIESDSKEKVDLVGMLKEAASLEEDKS